jgi:two-component system response regulator
MILERRVEGIIVFHIKGTLPESPEIKLLTTLSRDLAFANYIILLDRAKRQAFEVIEENINQFAVLVDGIRNPLAIINGFSELRIEDEETRKVFLESVERINNILKGVDARWNESKMMRRFLDDNL